MDFGQPEEMDEQYGSGYNSEYEKHWRVKGI